MKYRYLLAALALMSLTTVHVSAQSIAFPETGFAITDDAIAAYFTNHGGVETFGYPISREFVLRGSQVQLFQRTGLQVSDGGSVQPLNLLDPSLLSYSRIDGSTFPSTDPVFLLETPGPDQPNYAVRIAEFVRATVPDWIHPQLDLDVWGSPTSAPTPDPANPALIYQRFERGLMVHDAACQCTQGVLLGEYLKALITGDQLPADLASEASGSPLLRQYDESQPGAVARPAVLPDTDLSEAFIPET
jgi:hypothetical protein